MFTLKRSLVALADMTKVLPALVLSLAVLSCSKPEANVPPELPKRPKFFEVPQLIGKSPDEVKSLLGPPTSEAASDINGRPYYRMYYNFGRDSAAMIFINGKFDELIYTAYTIPFDGAEKMGEFFGIDVRGKAPRDVGGPGEWTVYENLTINGVTVNYVSFRNYGKRDYGKGNEYRDLHVRVEDSAAKAPLQKKK